MNKKKKNIIRILAIKIVFEDFNSNTLRQTGGGGGYSEQHGTILSI